MDCQEHEAKDGDGAKTLTKPRTPEHPLVCIDHGLLVGDAAPILVAQNINGLRTSRR